MPPAAEASILHATFRSGCPGPVDPCHRKIRGRFTAKDAGNDVGAAILIQILDGEGRILWLTPFDDMTHKLTRRNMLQPDDFRKRSLSSLQLEKAILSRRKYQPPLPF